MKSFFKEFGIIYFVGACQLVGTLYAVFGGLAGLLWGSLSEREQVEALASSSSVAGVFHWFELHLWSVMPAGLVAVGAVIYLQYQILRPIKVGEFEISSKGYPIPETTVKAGSAVITIH